MMRITMLDLQTDPGVYVKMAESQDVFVTKNGKPVAKLVPVKSDKEEALARLRQLFRGVRIGDDEVKRAREERLL